MCGIFRRLLLTWLMSYFVTHADSARLKLTTNQETTDVPPNNVALPLSSTTLSTTVPQSLQIDALPTDIHQVSSGKLTNNVYWHRHAGVVTPGLTSRNGSHTRYTSEKSGTLLENADFVSSSHIPAKSAYSSIIHAMVVPKGVGGVWRKRVAGPAAVQVYSALGRVTGTAGRFTARTYPPIADPHYPSRSPGVLGHEVSPRADLSITQSIPNKHISILRPHILYEPLIVNTTNHMVDVGRKAGTTLNRYSSIAPHYNPSQPSTYFQPHGHTHSSLLSITVHHNTRRSAVNHPMKHPIHDITSATAKHDIGSFSSGYNLRDSQGHQKQHKGNEREILRSRHSSIHISPFLERFKGYLEGSRNKSSIFGIRKPDKNNDVPNGNEGSDDHKEILPRAVTRTTNGHYSHLGNEHTRRRTNRLPAYRQSETINPELNSHPSAIDGQRNKPAPLVFTPLASPYHKNEFYESLSNLTPATETPTHSTVRPSARPTPSYSEGGPVDPSQLLIQTSDAHPAAPGRPPSAVITKPSPVNPENLLGSTETPPATLSFVRNGTNQTTNLRNPTTNQIANTSNQSNHVLPSVVNPEAVQISGTQHGQEIKPSSPFFSEQPPQPAYVYTTQSPPPGAIDPAEFLISSGGSPRPVITRPPNIRPHTNTGFNAQFEINTSGHTVQSTPNNGDPQQYYPKNHAFSYPGYIPGRPNTHGIQNNNYSFHPGPLPYMPPGFPYPNPGYSPSINPVPLHPPIPHEQNPEKPATASVAVSVTHEEATADSSAEGGDGIVSSSTTVVKGGTTTSNNNFYRPRPGEAPKRPHPAAVRPTPSDNQAARPRPQIIVDGVFNETASPSDVFPGSNVNVACSRRHGCPSFILKTRPNIPQPEDTRENTHIFDEARERRPEGNINIACDFQEGCPNYIIYTTPNPIAFPPLLSENSPTFSPTIPALPSSTPQPSLPSITPQISQNELLSTINLVLNLLNQTEDLDFENNQESPTGIYDNVFQRVGLGEQSNPLVSTPDILPAINQQNINDFTAYHPIPQTSVPISSSSPFLGQQQRPSFDLVRVPENTVLNPQTLPDLLDNRRVFSVNPILTRGGQQHVLGQPGSFHALRDGVVKSHLDALQQSGLGVTPASPLDSFVSETASLEDTQMGGAVPARPSLASILNLEQLDIPNEAPLVDASPQGHHGHHGMMRGALAAAVMGLPMTTALLSALGAPLAVMAPLGLAIPALLTMGFLDTNSNRGIFGSHFRRPINNHHGHHAHHHETHGHHEATGDESQDDVSASPTPSLPGIGEGGGLADGGGVAGALRRLGSLVPMLAARMVSGHTRRRRNVLDRPREGRMTPEMLLPPEDLRTLADLKQFYSKLSGNSSLVEKPSTAEILMHRKYLFSLLQQLRENQGPGGSNQQDEGKNLTRDANPRTPTTVAITPPQDANPSTPTTAVTPPSLDAVAPHTTSTTQTPQNRWENGVDDTDILQSTSVNRIGQFSLDPSDALGLHDAGLLQQPFSGPLASPFPGQRPYDLVYGHHPPGSGNRLHRRKSKNLTPTASSPHLTNSNSSSLFSSISKSTDQNENENISTSTPKTPISVNILDHPYFDIHQSTSSSDGLKNDDNGYTNLLNQSLVLQKLPEHHPGSPHDLVAMLQTLYLLRQVDSLLQHHNGIPGYGGYVGQNLYSAQGDQNELLYNPDYAAQYPMANTRLVTQINTAFTTLAQNIADAISTFLTEVGAAITAQPALVLLALIPFFMLGGGGVQPLWWLLLLG